MEHLKNLITRVFIFLFVTVGFPIYFIVVLLFHLEVQSHRRQRAHIKAHTIRPNPQMALNLPSYKYSTFNMDCNSGAVATFSLDIDAMLPFTLGNTQAITLVTAALKPYKISVPKVESRTAPYKLPFCPIEKQWHGMERPGLICVTSLRPALLLHEAVHSVTGYGHGPDFAAVYRELILRLTSISPSEVDHWMTLRGVK